MGWLVEPQHQLRFGILSDRRRHHRADVNLSLLVGDARKKHSIRAWKNGQVPADVSEALLDHVGPRGIKRLRGFHCSCWRFRSSLEFG